MHEELKKAVEVLRNGGVILYPTDAGWALGCDATNENAVNKLLEIKNPVDNEPLVVLIDNSGRLQSYLDEVPDIAWDLIELSEKPLTIIFSNARNLATNLLRDKSIGIRVTNEDFSKRLCQQFKRPVVVHPANEKDLSFAGKNEGLKNKADFTVDVRHINIAKAVIPSTIKLGKGNVIDIIRE